MLAQLNMTVQLARSELRICKTESHDHSIDVIRPSSVFVRPPYCCCWLSRSCHEKATSWPRDHAIQGQREGEEKVKGKTMGKAAQNLLMAFEISSKPLPGLKKIAKPASLVNIWICKQLSYKFTVLLSLLKIAFESRKNYRIFRMTPNNRFAIFFINEWLTYLYWVGRPLVPKVL